MTKTIQIAILLLLCLIALRPAAYMPAVQAASEYPDLYIEPGTTMLRTPDGRGQVQGKVMIDRRTGDVWGFPTGTSAPYPVVTTSPEPPHSKPIYLGRFEFSAMKRAD
jgi:hypothetical protein